MTPSRVVVLGGGLSGLAAAETLADTLEGEVTVLESSSRLGGLAGSLEVDGGSYPLGYHHILEQDRALRLFLDEAGLTSRLQWRRVRMLVESGSRLFDLARPRDFLRFPLGLRDKWRFVRMMWRAQRFQASTELGDSSAAELLDRWSSPGVRESLFEPLTQLKFRTACADLSGAWLLARLRFREATSPLGYLSGTNWTTLLCDFITGRCRARGCRLETSAPVCALESRDGRIRAAITTDGRRFEAESFVNSVPPPIYLQWVDDRTPALARIRYTSLLSMIAACPSSPLQAYWANLSSLRHAACAVFDLSALNPTIGRDDRCLNFVTHLGSTDDALWRKTG